MLTDKNKTMDIYSPAGTKIIFTYPDNGYPADVNLVAEIGLVVGEEYTVEKTKIGGSRFLVQIKEFPRYMFNTVHFTNKPEDKPVYRGEITIHKDEILDRLDELALVAQVFKGNRDRKLPVNILRRALIESAKDVVEFIKYQEGVDKAARENLFKEIKF